MDHKPRLATTMFVLVTGCASVAERQKSDVSDVARQMRERTGLEWREAPREDGTIAPEVSELLEGALTEDAAVKVAILNNRDVRAEFARLGVASSELVRAGLLANPVFTANAKFFDGGTEIELGIVESFFDVFFLSARKRVAEADFEAAKARIARTLVGVVYDVRRAFVEVLAAERLVQVEREILRAAQASYDLMRDLHQAGNVIDPQFTAEDVALAEAKLSVARAEAAALDAREPLNVLLGLWGDSVGWRVDGMLDDEVSAGLDFERVETRAIKASLELAEVRAHATSEARRAGLVGWEEVFSPGELGLAAKQEVGSSEWGVGPALGLSLPLFGASSASRARAEGELREALARHVSLAVEVRSAARRLRDRTVALSDEARFLREEQLPRAARLVRETLRNYNAMQIGVFDVFMAKQREIEMARSYVETLRDAWLARLDLQELFAGRLDEERVAAAPSPEHASTTPSLGAHP